jgi:hypothetical protein
MLAFVSIGTVSVQNVMIYFTSQTKYPALVFNGLWLDIASTKDFLNGTKA